MREIRVARIPRGLPVADDFVVAEAPMPVAGAGEVLVRNRWFTVFAALRTLLAGVSGAPMPGLTVGDTLFGPAIGEVVQAPADSGLKDGDLVKHMLGWREYAVLPAAGLTRLDGDPVPHLAQVPTAHGAFTRAARLQPGDTVFVSGGAGSLGSVAGQVAKLLGAGRVIGGTGSAWKAEQMLTDFGYDAVVARGDADQLAAAAPDGIDVFFDNTGGDDLRAALAVARPHARFALVGALSGQLSATGPGTTAPVEIDTFALILKQITVTGYSGQEETPEWLLPRINFRYARVDGLAAAPQAVQDALTGRYAGTVIVAV
ncbi:MDR family NADP-dependent oxidoreductase [Actinoplanes couchii]|uniref:NADP-dependent oxidoreductase n=1 Tax=Actinoplanes couchii TaxID=403638 RepID=A0ABQ3XKB0_9ACTN|nr:NADP-dependent oxidoreductase [Actinoplanes couchii]MDR6320525.1 2-alkenal reductase [Actinoplanes couchii]GID58929.1 NADP-dependent oxidoreductase [Actinoplanes couchii]